MRSLTFCVREKESFKDTSMAVILDQILLILPCNTVLSECILAFAYIGIF